MKHLIKIVFCIFVFTGCEALRPETTDQEYFTVALWNLDNLFDGVEAGTEYAEFRMEAGWNQEKYQARLTGFSQAISQMSGTGFPGLIGLVEIENLGVLEDLSQRLNSDHLRGGLARGSLAHGGLAKNGYYWAAFAKLPGSAVGIGFISRFPLTDVKAHSITVEGETTPRPVLEVRLEARGAPLVFLLCHWKSKLGGEDATEALRRASARVVQRRLGEIREAEPGTPVIVMGDLNDNHNAFYRRGPSILLSLLPDDPDAAALANNTLANNALEYLVLSAEKPPRSRYFPENLVPLYSPWTEEIFDGSYFFRGGWESIDHFLLSAALFDNSLWDYSYFEVLNREPFVKDDGTPNAYMSRIGRGLSDHLPMLLHLSYSDERRSAD
jgi:endonuclease/exonuclease/phosphatase family metal-dependent hydrolase